jgi:glycosyltransferase EpsD
MKKRILITSTDSMMKQFLEPHVLNLLENGYEVEIACSEVLNRMAEIHEDLGKFVKIHHLRLQRSPLSKDNLKGYKEIKQIIDNVHFDLIWTNEPVMGVVTRLAARDARKAGTKVMYMVHGFHFYKGAPLVNWLVYYPIERCMASQTDTICTINQEDYARLRKFNVSKKAYIHGVGINTDRLVPANNGFNLRECLSIPDSAFIVLSVGELNRNKNQQVIIRALSLLNDPEIHYVLCGKGDELDNLKALSTQLGLNDHVHFMGYQNTLFEIYSQSDVFAMPSRREGLPVASLEAMYCGLPLVASDIRGLSDIVTQGKNGFLCDPDNMESFSKKINDLKKNASMRKQINTNNREKVKLFCMEHTKNEVTALVKSILG